MTDLLDLEILDYEDYPIANSSSQTDMSSNEIEEFELKNGVYFNVSCNLGRLIVKASQLANIPRNIEIGLQRPTHRVSHGDQVSGDRTLKEVLNLGEVHSETVQAKIVDENISVHYEATNMPLVTYMGIADSTAQL